MTPDLVNGWFETMGAVFIGYNCFVLYRDKKVRGVSVWSVVFFTTWGLWNLYYYPSLDQWASFTGGVAIAMMNLIWVCQAFYYGWGRHE